jgi:DNA repair protein RecN (Recombination protein N)
MLNSLLIQNYAIIEKLELDFSDNLTIITGETGAGKSILLGALELVLGKRADTKVLYNHDKKCVVEACFKPDVESVVSLFETHDLDHPEEIIIRREISNSGKSRAFVNDTPVNLTVLAELSAKLLELHRQFDTLDIYKPEYQTKILDALANNLDVVKSYKIDFQVLNSDKKHLEKLLLQKSKAEEENEYIQFQFDELNALDLENMDQESLENELSKLSNAEEIISISSNIHRSLTEDENSISEHLKDVYVNLKRVAEFSPDADEFCSRLDAAMEEIKDISAEIGNVGESMVYDEEQIQEVQHKLDELYKIQQKHRTTTFEDLVVLRDSLSEKLKTHSGIASEIIKLKKKIQQDETKLYSQARKISERRKKIAPKLSSSIESMLQKLSMEHAQLQIDIKSGEVLLSNGLDEINFLFSPNKGSDFSLIKNIASGGELSRLALCIKANVASALTLPTMIFDELDTGISGEVAMKMGDIMNVLAKQHQIIAITHSPLIAAKADLHFSVFKSVEGERTLTKIKELDPKQRVSEIAKMLGGDPPGENAIKNAKELLAVSK